MIHGSYDYGCNPAATPDFVCPWCGETEGEPVEIWSMEYQGESPHGGMVETCQDACTLCYGSLGPIGEPLVPLLDTKEELEGCPF